MTNHTAPRTRDLELLSIVLPVFNEESILEALAAQVDQAAASCAASYEIIFVNDGSLDGSPATLDRLTEQYPAVCVVHLSRNYGHQAAVHAGLSHASGDAIVLMDSDMQDDPAAIPRFLERWRAGADVVYAIRTDRKESSLKRFLFTAFYRVLNRVSEIVLPLDAGNFGLIDRRVQREMLAMGETDRYYPGLRAWVGFRQEGIEIERLARYDEKPRVSMAGLFRLAKTAIFSFSKFPLALFYFIGIVSLLISVGVWLLVLYHKLITGFAIPGWASFLGATSFFGAINSLGIALIGEYIVRIYDQVRARPVFIVDRVVGKPDN